MFDSSIWPISAPLQDIMLRSVSDPDFDLSRSLKVKCDGVIRLSIYAFLLIFMSNRISIPHRLAVIATQDIFSYILSLDPKLRKIEKYYRNYYL